MACCQDYKQVVEKGHLSCLKALHKNGLPWSYWLPYNLAANGHLDCLKYAHQNGCARPTGEQAEDVSSSPWNIYIPGFATENGQWTCHQAILNGHFECLKYLHENGCPWDEDTTICAAANGHLKILQYAHENGCPWHESVCSDAAYGGHLDCLKYAHENGCPWNEWTCSDAAYGGHLDCLKYAHENGCPWNERTTLNANMGIYDECLRYAYYHGCPIDKDYQEQAEKLIKEIQDKYKAVLKQTIQKKYNVCTDIIGEIVKYIY